MKHAFAKSVSNVMWKWASHGNAWHATHGKTKKVSQRTAQVRNAAFYRICTTCEGMKTCCGCSTRKAAADFSAGAWKRTQARTRLCLVCARNAHASRKRQVAFNNGTSQHRAQNGQQVCDSCQGPKLERMLSERQSRVWLPRTSK